MGTTLANLHILGGDEQQLHTLLPKATVGSWSARFVSAYFQEFDPRLCEKTARALSKKLAQPVLLAWIFDSDAVGFVVYQGGKSIAEHILNPDGHGKMGNIALFCESLGLPADDVQRLRAIWKKGDAEEQMGLTALLLGLPLYNNCEMLPNKQHFRDSGAVDKWIAERPAPPKITSETKAVLAQELTRFRWYYPYCGGQYCSVEPYDNEYSCERIQFWVPNEDGIIQPGWSTEKDLYFQESDGRMLGINIPGGVIAYDSAGVLAEGYQTKGSILHFMSDGGLLWRDISPDLAVTTFIRCAKDGSELWMKGEKNKILYFWGCENDEIIFTSVSPETHWVERVDGITGATIEKMPSPFGYNAWSKAYHNGYWWVAHNGHFLNDGNRVDQGDTLTKLDGALRPLAKLPLQRFTQEIFFSPDNVHVYIFICKSQVMVINAETLAIENILKDKSSLGPLGFDSAGRFWLRRDNSTVEAWDAGLSRPRSRHKVKGEIRDHHMNEQGVMCVVAWSKKEKVLRVYKLE